MWMLVYKRNCVYYSSCKCAVCERTNEWKKGRQGEGGNGTTHPLSPALQFPNKERPLDSNTKALAHFTPTSTLSFHGRECKRDVFSCLRCLIFASVRFKNMSLASLFCLFVCCWRAQSCIPLGNGYLWYVRCIACVFFLSPHVCLRTKGRMIRLHCCHWDIIF